MISSVELFAIALYEKGFLQGNGDQINDLLEHHKAMYKKETASNTLLAALVELDKAAKEMGYEVIVEFKKLEK